MHAHSRSGAVTRTLLHRRKEGFQERHLPHCMWPADPRWLGREWPGQGTGEEDPEVWRCQAASEYPMADQISMFSNQDHFFSPRHSSILPWCLCPTQEKKRRDNHQGVLATDMPPSLISPVLTLPKPLAFREGLAQAQGRRRQAHSFPSLPADSTHVRSQEQTVAGSQEQTAYFSDGDTEAQRS